MDKPKSDLKILTPAEEFAQKKQSWRIPTNQQNQMNKARVDYRKPQKDNYERQTQRKPSDRQSQKQANDREFQRDTYERESQRERQPQSEDYERPKVTQKFVPSKEIEQLARSMHAEPEYYSDSVSHQSDAGSSSASAPEYDKPRVKRFGEYEVDKGSIIPEIYKYDLKDYEPCSGADLKEGVEILFKTLELDEATLTPAISAFKRGRINWVDEKFANISLLREFREEELDWLKDQEIIDEHILEKYELTLDKGLLTDLKRKTDSSDMDIN
mmetsp:Transcript_19552/g.35815  ORF Transcript_19552/g.35815 Transcript_19552/m.35815 type:complete len:271 (-) Transcript_19552:3170-3982(-)